MSVPQIPLWKDRIVVEKALKYCKQSYENDEENAEKRQKIENEETVFFAAPGKERNDQKCVIALCKNPVLSKEDQPWKDLYVAFRGTDVKDYHDVLTDMEVETKSCETWSNDDIKFHGGFLERAKLCTDPEKGILAKIEEFGFKPNRVIITGHSLGAAVSALVYIELAKKQQELKLSYDICNLTFACPLFGNKALKTYVDENQKQFGNMFHFIKQGDIVPAACFIETAFNHLGWWIRYAIGTTAGDNSRLIAGQGNKMIKDNVDRMKEGRSDEDKKDIDTVVAKAKEIISDLYNKDVDHNYAPIGRFIMDKGFPDTWVELSEKVEETLKDTLKIFSEFSFHPSKKDEDAKVAKDLGEKHELKTYEGLLLADS